ncbi:hypothetical protein HK096_011468, partial [Nowakowskiella sp. JEL0078]
MPILSNVRALNNADVAWGAVIDRVDLTVKLFDIVSLAIFTMLFQLRFTVIAVLQPYPKIYDTVLLIVTVTLCFGNFIVSVLMYYRNSLLDSVGTAIFNLYTSTLISFLSVTTMTFITKNKRKLLDVESSPPNVEELREELHQTFSDVSRGLYSLVLMSWLGILIYTLGVILMVINASLANIGYVVEE